MRPANGRSICSSGAHSVLEHDPKGGPKPINAMAEIVRSKPMFREAYRRACAFLMDALECRLNAETALPNEWHKNSPVIQDHIIRCMNDFGYEWTHGAQSLQRSAGRNDPFCYLPARFFDRVVIELQMKFE
jgi:hypothetical protein